jgi:hypothetical protein
MLRLSMTVPGMVLLLALSIFELVTLQMERMDGER